MSSHISPTEDDRLMVVMQALWFAAKHYTPEEGTLLATMDVTEAATSVIAMLDDLHMLPSLKESIAC